MPLTPPVSTAYELFTVAINPAIAAMLYCIVLYCIVLY